MNANNKKQINKNINIEKIPDFLLINFVSILVLAESFLLLAMIDNVIHLMPAPLRK